MSGLVNVEKNSKGGIKVTADDLGAAFRMLSKDGRARVSLAALSERLAAIFPLSTLDDAKALLGEGEKDRKVGVTARLLEDLLLDNQVTQFDAAAAAFSRAFDPHGTGFLDPTALKGMWTRLGFREPLTDDDIALLAASVGSPHGRVSLDDFRYKLLPVTRTRRPTRDELARAPEEN